MEKLLHERLRESGDVYSMLCKEYSQEYSGDKYMDWSYAAQRLADEIERYYIPRPRFEDGEPVQFGDRFMNNHGEYQTVTSIAYTRGESDYVRINGNSKLRLNEPVKRPTQKVYDADGVEIKEGVVGFYYDGTRLRVLRVEPELGDYCVYVRDRVTCFEYYIKPEKFTLKEPDSQKRIDEDARKLVENISSRYEIDGTIWASDGIDGVGATTLLDEVAELLSRQRTLIERGA